MADFPQIQKDETPTLIVATGRDDLLYRPSAKAVHGYCGNCDREVMLDEKSQGLLCASLPFVHVVCIQCFAGMVQRGEHFVIRRA